MITKMAIFKALHLWQLLTDFEKNKFFGISMTNSDSIPNLKKIRRGGCKFSIFLDHLTWNDLLEKNTNCENLSLLDVQIKLNDIGYDTCVWQKSTNTGLLPNFNALCPNTWKSGLILCWLHRPRKLCLSTELYVQELKRLGHIFCYNECPDWFINTAIKKFEKRQSNPLDEYEQDFLYTIGIPFFGKASQVFAKKLTALVEAKFNVDIICYYT